MKMFKEEDMKSTDVWKILQRVGGKDCRQSMIIHEFYQHDKYKDGLIELIRLKIVEDPRSEIELCFDFSTGSQVIYIALYHFSKMAHVVVKENEIDSALKGITSYRMEYFLDDEIRKITFAKG
jgi:hypothetical protein